MRILSANKYPERTVLRVVFNDDEPEWAHVIGALLLSDEGDRILDSDNPGDLLLVTDATVPAGHTGNSEQAKESGRTLCHNCKSNWEIREYLWDGADRFYDDADGVSQSKTDDMLLDELDNRIKAEAAEKASIDTLVGKVLEG